MITKIDWLLSGSLNWLKKQWKKVAPARRGMSSRCNRVPARLSDLGLNWPKSLLLIVAIVALLMLLAGCSQKRIAVQPPAPLVAPIELPALNIRHDMQCLDYSSEVTKVMLDMLEVYEQCETQKRETVKFYKGLE